MSRTPVILMTPWSGPWLQRLMSLAPPSIAVTPLDFNEPHEVKARALQKAEYLIVTPSDVAPALLLDCPRIRLVQLLSAGYDRLELEAIADLGVVVANNGGANAIAVAEHTVGLILVLLRRLDQQCRNVRDGLWRGNLHAGDIFELAGKTVGVVGAGRIGLEVASRLQGWRVTLVYNSPHPICAEVELKLGMKRLPLDDLLSTSDIVSLHVPLTEATRHMIGTREFDLMKTSACLINTSRGGVVDENALRTALERGRIRGAALDVLEKEPVPEGASLAHLTNLVVTPHLAGTTTDTLVRSLRLAFENVTRMVSGQAPLAVVAMPSQPR